MFYMIPVQIPFLLRAIGVESGTAAGVVVAAASLTAAARLRVVRRACGGRTACSGCTRGRSG